LVGLHVVESLQYILHQIVLSGNQQPKIDGVGVVRLAIAHMVPCVYHLTGRLGTNIRFYKNPNYMQQGIYGICFHLFISLMMRSWIRC
jgi:hypothetical protein